METPMSACGKCERTGVLCVDCQRHCDHKSHALGQCCCPCHAELVTRLPRRSNFEKVQRFFVKKGPRYGEVITVRKDLSWDAAKHAAVRLVQQTLEGDTS